jgi:hypothetical protein
VIVAEALYRRRWRPALLPMIPLLLTSWISVFTQPGNNAQSGLIVGGATIACSLTALAMVAADFSGATARPSVTRPRVSPPGPCGLRHW